MPFTQNNHYLQTCTQKWLAKYKDVRTKKAMMRDQAAATKKQTTNATTPGTPSPVVPAVAPMSNGFSFASNPITKPATASSIKSEGNTFASFGKSAPVASPFGSNAPAAVAPNPFGQSPAAETSFGGRRAPAAAPASVPFAYLAPSGTPEATDEAQNEKLNQALSALAELGYHGLTSEDLGKLNPPDIYETEMEVMAKVRGYFQVTYKVRGSAYRPCFLD
jgi:hypothetical protein